jgi:deoxyribose-phosphate aldolase
VKLLSRAELAACLDHTLVQCEATRSDVERLCADAVEHGFHGVCVNGSRVQLAYALLEETNIKVTAMIGFPLGAADADAKRYEVEVAIDQGAHELELVLNIGRLLEGDHDYVLKELRDIAEAADERPVKVILESHLLTSEQKRRACELVLDSGAHFVCNNTGLNADASTADIKALRQFVGEGFGVKASGAFRDWQAALSLLEAGATRLGTACGVELVSGMPG